MGKHTRICIYAKQVSTDPLHESTQTGQHQEIDSNRVGRSKAKEKLQIPRLDDGYEAALERTYRGDETKGNEDSSRTQLSGRIQLGRQPGRHAENFRRHCAHTDDVCVLNLVKRKFEGEAIHKEDAQHLGGHPSKSGKVGMQSLQSHIESRTQHRDFDPSYRAANMETQ